MLLRKKIYQISLAATIFAFGSLLFASSALAEKTNEIKVELWNGSEWELLCQDEECQYSLKVFDTDNFLPGDTTYKKVRITNVDVTGNGSGVKQDIAIEAINVENPCLDLLCLPFIGNKFGDILNFKVTEEGGDVKYEKTLSKFFDESGETIITTLENSASKDFDFSVYFNDTDDNKYQKRSLGFDIIFGLKGDEGGAPPSSGGSGGGLPLGLTIQYEDADTVGSNYAEIEWWTSYNATSQVVYSSECEYKGTCTEGKEYKFDFNDNQWSFGLPPKYGYKYTTEETNYPYPDGPNKVTYRKVRIDGLTSGTTYYYRAISHASPPTVSRERSFTTLAMSSESDGSKENEFEKEEASEYLPPSNDENAGETGGEISFRTSPVPKTSDGGNSAGDSADLTNSGNVLGASSNPESAEKNVLNGGSASKPLLAGINDSARVDQGSFDNFIFLALALIIIGLILYIIKLKKNQKKNI